jgi:hypothetical protein
MRRFQIASERHQYIAEFYDTKETVHLDEEAADDFSNLSAKTYLLRLAEFEADRGRYDEAGVAQSV